MIPEFLRAYEPEGMTPEEFITFGATQKTLTQFYHSGWSLLETFPG
jgi:transaldolase